MRRGGDGITIYISPTSGQPLYEQIVEQVRLQVLQGTLRDGDQLPSIRALARELQVSIITTKRAYEELEREGILTVSTGRGTFVHGGGVAESKKSQLRELRGELRQAAKLAKALDVGPEQFQTLAAQIYRGEDPDD